MAAAHDHTAVPAALIDKIGALPRERIAEIQDFVNIIAMKDGARALNCAGAATSVPAFAVVWNNPRTMFTMPSETAGLGFGDVVLVPLPFTDQTASKQRPAVVISTASYDAVRPHPYGHHQPASRFRCLWRNLSDPLAGRGPAAAACPPLHLGYQETPASVDQYTTDHAYKAICETAAVGAYVFGRLHNHNIFAS